ncbi:hypothetical protein VZO05_08260 [Aggregatilineales bacterium SYSU G02658]
MTLTAMVFTVRYAEYAENESPNFWGKYARMVWQTEADQTFQNEERRCFRRMRNDLIDRSGLLFLTQAESKQDVVGSIYLHAILPSYLQDDFARWLVGWFRQDTNWQQLAYIPLADVQAQWTNGSVSLVGISKRLKRFLESAESAPTAARLVQTMAIAANEYLQGDESLSDPLSDSLRVKEMLSPIERDLWDELVKVVEPLRQQQSSRDRRRVKTLNLRFAWHLEQNCFGILVKNWIVSTKAAPDRLVWASTAEQLDTYEHFVTVTPWQTASGLEVDSAFVRVGQLSGAIGLVDQDDNVLESHPLPPLPNDLLLYFRLDKDETLALLTPLDRISDGDYVIVSRESCTYEIKKSDGTELTAQDTLAIPTPLQDAKYNSAQRYTIKLPVNILQVTNSSEDQIYVRNKRGVISAVLEGQPLLPASNLNVYYDAPKLRLVNVRGIQSDVERLRLRVLTNDQVVVDQYLRDLTYYLDEDDLLIDLRSLNLTSARVYEIRLQRNFALTLDEPLTFFLAPTHVRFQCEDPKGYYSYTRPFKLMLYGCSDCEVIAPHATITNDPEATKVVWSNPLMPCEMQLRWDQATVTLQFNVHWRHVWVEPENKHLTISDLNKTYLMAIGQRNDRYRIHVGQLEPRSLKLNASGEYRQLIADDPIYDMIRECASLRVPVYAEDGQTKWDLFTVSFYEDDELSAAAQQARRSLQHLRRRGQAHLQTSSVVSLLALPREYLDDVLPILPTELANPFEMLKEVERRLPHFSHELVPRLELTLHFGEQCAVTAKLDKAPTTQFESEGEVMFVRDKLVTRSIRATFRTIDKGILEVRFKPERDSLLECSICKAVFLDHTTQRLHHAHGQGLKAPKPRPLNNDQPVVARVKTLPQVLDQWQLDFSDEYYCRSALENVRIRDTASKPQSWTCLTLDHVRAATRQMKPKIKELTESHLTPNRIKLILGVVETLINTLTCLEDSYLPARPLLSILNFLEKHGEDRLDKFAYALVACGILYRAASRNQPELTNLLEENNEIVHQFLVNVFPLAPFMVGWAWAWAELYMLYYDFVPQKR